MRFHIGAIPETPDFSPDASWRALHEPTPWGMQLFALPIAFFAGTVVLFLWFIMTPLAWGTARMSLPVVLLSFAGAVAVHELIHLAVHPMFARSRHSVLGFWPSRVLFYAHYDGELARDRFVAILLMPLAVMSLFPLLVATVAQVSSGWAAYVSSFSALLACGDILGAGIVLFQIPATARVRNQGWRTYWRERRAERAEPGAPANG